VWRWSAFVVVPGVDGGAMAGVRSGGGASELERLVSRGPSSPARRVHNDWPTCRLAVVSTALLLCIYKAYVLPSRGDQKIGCGL
jgi:hypothetical protein